MTAADRRFASYLALGTGAVLMAGGWLFLMAGTGLFMIAGGLVAFVGAIVFNHSRNAALPLIAALAFGMVPVIVLAGAAVWVSLG